MVLQVITNSQEFNMGAPPTAKNLVEEAENLSPEANVSEAETTSEVQTEKEGE